MLESDILKSACLLASDLSDPLIPDRCPDPDCLFKSGGMSYATLYSAFLASAYSSGWHPRPLTSHPMPSPQHIQAREDKLSICAQPPAWIQAAHHPQPCRHRPELSPCPGHKGGPNPGTYRSCSPLRPSQRFHRKSRNWGHLVSQHF